MITVITTIRDVNYQRWRRTEPESRQRRVGQNMASAFEKLSQIKNYYNEAGRPRWYIMMKDRLKNVRLGLVDDGIFLPLERFVEMGYKVVPRLHESRLLTPSGHMVRIHAT